LSLATHFPPDALPVGSLRARRFWRSFARYAALVFFAALFAMPIVWMLKTSLMEPLQAKAMPPTWLPEPFRFGNYRLATEAIPFWLYTANTLVLCALNVLGTTLSCSLVAWGFAYYRFPGRDFFFLLTLSTMMIPFPVLMVPQYSIFRGLDWIGTTLPLWVPSFFASAWNIFLLRQFFAGVPRDLVDAARIDGTGEFRIFWQIVLPLSRPALMVVVLFCFLHNWNDFLAPLIYLTDDRQFTLTLGLQAFQSRLGEIEITLLMAATTLMILPVIVLFFFAQRTFIEGISLTGLKG